MHHLFSDPNYGNWFADCGVERRGPYPSQGIATQVAASEALALRKKQLLPKISIHRDISLAVLTDIDTSTQSKRFSARTDVVRPTVSRELTGFGWVANTSLLAG